MSASLLDLLFPPRPTELLLRQAGKEALITLLDPHVVNEDGIIALLPYEHPLVTACVIEAKFHENRRAQEVLGNVLGSFLAIELAERRTYEYLSYALVPVPLSRARLKERGYNQAECIARHGAIGLKNVTVIADLVVRTRDTLPQTTLGREARPKNVEGAFRLTREPDPDVTYIVIDDVVTTDSTLCEIASLLPGAELLALAH